VGNKRRRRRRNPQLSSGHATSPAEGAGRPRDGVVAGAGSPSGEERGAAHGGEAGQRTGGRSAGEAEKSR
jgi:hypothetical protein